MPSNLRRLSALAGVVTSVVVSACDKPLAVQVIEIAPAVQSWHNTCDPLELNSCPIPKNCRLYRNGTFCTQSPSAPYSVTSTHSSLSLTHQEQKPSTRPACQPDTCKPSWACVDTADAHSPHCQKLCKRSSGEGCMSPNQACLLAIHHSPYGICTDMPTRCSLPEDGRCGANHACQPLWRPSGQWTLHCLPVGHATENAPCNPTTNPCAAGLVCVIGPEESVPACARMCALNADCPEPMQCTGKAKAPYLRFCQD